MKQSLKNRSFLGPTSTDAELSLVMVNLGLICAGRLIWDPFVGSGSLLIASTHHGAICFGSDIDMQIISGKEGKSMRDNFEQYHLPFPELFCVDASARGASALSAFHLELDPRTGAFVSPSQAFFHAIVTDPPYGIRAGARKSGTTGRSADAAETSHPMLLKYSGVEVMRDLLELAARVLVCGGRLVYLLPVDKNYVKNKHQLPSHPCLNLIADSGLEQKLDRSWSRRLITMEKRVEYGVDHFCAFQEQLRLDTESEGESRSDTELFSSRLANRKRLGRGEVT